MSVERRQTLVPQTPVRTVFRIPPPFTLFFPPTTACLFPFFFLLVPPAIAPQPELGPFLSFSFFREYPLPPQPPLKWVPTATSVCFSPYPVDPLEQLPFLPFLSPPFSGRSLSKILWDVASLLRSSIAFEREREGLNWFFPDRPRPTGFSPLFLSKGSPPLDTGVSFFSGTPLDGLDWIVVPLPPFFPQITVRFPFPCMCV